MAKARRGVARGPRYLTPPPPQNTTDAFSIGPHRALAHLILRGLVQHIKRILLPFLGSWPAPDMGLWPINGFVDSLVPAAQLLTSSHPHSLLYRLPQSGIPPSPAGMAAASHLRSWLHCHRCASASRHLDI